MPTCEDSGPNIGTIKVHGFKDLQFGQVITGIDIHNHAEAMLLEIIIHNALRDMAGLPAEKVLARWSNSIASSRRRAIRERWVGWDIPSHQPKENTDGDQVALKEQP